jgi:hypothetical protein
MRFLIAFFAIVWGCLTALTAAAADAYRCKDANGKMVYTNVHQGGHCEKIDHPITLTAPYASSERFDPPRSAQINHRRGNTRDITITGRKDNRAPSSSTSDRTSIVQDSPTQVGSQTQRTRDQKRLDILQEELDIELRNLAQAKANLAASTANKRASSSSDSNTHQLRAQILQHEKNIVALKREIDRTR